ncbi:sialate O-acetylesterase [Massilia sp. PWRC2]|uniref:sialate O-acetylesterase n=1 Tax=Massilia sp. PWRC2 TaxID=2804626 RepID=UPI003CF5DB51
MIADRVKDTSTSTGTGNFVLSGTPATGFQALSAIGATGSTFGYVIDGGAEWEVGTGTITATNTFSRSPTASSNAGALVSFSAGTKTVFHSVTAKQFGAGIVDPADVGFDIILLAGQSNMAGRGTYDALVDIGSDRIMQFGGFSSDARYRTIFSGADPLHQTEAVETGLVGPATIAARTYCAARPSNRRVLLVPTAVGGTTLVALTPGWAPGNPGGSLYEGAIAQANLAVTAALALYPNSRFVGTLWHQGESDGDNAVSQASYTAALKLLVAGFRSRITGAAGSWFVIGGLCPEGITATPARAGIKAAHIQVTTDLDRCAYVDGPSGMADTNHYTAPGIRILGARMGVAVDAARNYTAPVVAAAAVTLVASGTTGIVGTPVTITVGTDRLLTGAQSVSVAVSHVLAGAVTGSPVTLNAATPTAAVSVAESAVGSDTITAVSTGTPTLAGASVGYTVTASATVPATMSAPVATAGDATASIAFTAPSSGGSAITSYTITPYIGATAQATQTTTTLTSPYVATGLTNSTAYTFKIHANNAIGSGVDSLASGSVMPVAVVTYATWNPADKNANVVLSNGNKTVAGTVGAGGAFESIRSTVSKTAGKWYWETTIGAVPTLIGIGRATATLSDFAGNNADSWGYYHTGSVYNAASPTTVDAYVAGDVIAIALDMGAGTVAFYKNNVLQATKTGVTGTLFAMATVKDGAPPGSFTTNFGASAFAYTPPSGFVGLQ